MAARTYHRQWPVANVLLAWLDGSSTRRAPGPGWVPPVGGIDCTDLLHASPKMKSLALLAAVLAALIARSDVFADDALDAKYPRLAALKLPAELLPAGCSLETLPDNVKELQGLKNGQITTDPRFFLIGDERLTKLLDGKQIEAVYFGLYKEKNELGVIGWACINEAAAKSTREKLAESYKNELNRFRLWQVDKCVVWLWRDPGVSDRCFNRLETVVQARFTGDKAAATALVESDKLDAQAKAIALEFLKALKAEDVGAVMKLVETPFFWDGKENVADREELKRQWVAAFDLKKLMEIEYEVKETVALADLEVGLGSKGRELLNQVLDKTDRIVIMSLTVGSRKDGIAVMVRLREGQANVAGFSD